ncbi:MAG TPA: hypothetical protein VLJ42_01665 [Solirubrobacteraceae bacterium]|nr:hypothetical protein [Solirubrobacteraceae bacterium]
MRGRGAVFKVQGPIACVALAGLLASGCGQARQDAHEVKGDFAVRVLSATFPAKQAIAKPSRMTVRVRNTGAHTIPNVAVSVDSFGYTDTAPDLGASQRPVWIIDQGPGAIAKPAVPSVAEAPPGGGQTAYVNTWALGPLASGHTETFTWRVTPVKAGAHTVHFSVAAGLNGKARAQLAGGGAPGGQFKVRVAPAPPANHVDPATGQVVPGALPVGP